MRPPQPIAAIVIEPVQGEGGFIVPAPGFLPRLAEYAREQGCGLVELTTDKSREDAHRFYDRLGFEPSHIGYKLKLV